MGEKPVLTFDAVSVGQSLGSLPFDRDTDAIVGAALEGSPVLKSVGGSYLDPAVLAGNHLLLIFNSFRIDTAIHASTQIESRRRFRASDIAVVRGTVAEKEVRRGRCMVVVESQTLDNSGNVLSVERNRLVIPRTEGEVA